MLTNLSFSLACLSYVWYISLNINQGFASLQYGQLCLHSNQSNYLGFYYHRVIIAMYTV